VQDLEKMVAGLKIKPSAGDSAGAIIGGLGAASSGQAAVEWVRDALQKLCIKSPQDVYHKCGDRDFNGMVFVRFDSANVRDEAIVTFNASKSFFSHEKKYLNPDLPTDERIPRSFLFAFKRLLADWEFRKPSVNVNTDTAVLSVEGLPVVKAFVEAGVLELEWLSDKWLQWKDLQDDQAFTKLIQDAKDKLSKSVEGRSKGKGRSPA
jgi:hypothetical protein